MIVVDTSALMAIALREPEAMSFERAIFKADTALVGAPTMFEFELAASSRKLAIAHRPQAIQAELNLLVVAWTEEHVATATEALRRYGKGHGHPAKLNFGDCMSYALAKALDAPLLYKGNDFAMTDIRSAL